MLNLKVINNLILILKHHLDERSRKVFFVLIILLIATSCSNNTFNTEDELLDYLKEESNGYTHNKTVNGVDFTLTYRPTDLMVNQELGDSITSNKIETLRNKYSKYLYFNLNMSRNNQELLNSAVGSKKEFGQMVNQLAFGMNEKVHLYTQSKDTIEMADFIYPRMYGMSKATSILFVFPRDKESLKEDVLNFTIEDIGFYTGEVKFKIETQKLTKQPKLAFKIK